MVEATARSLGLDEQGVHGLSEQYPFVMSQALTRLTLNEAGAHFEQRPEGALLERTAIPLFLESCLDCYQILVQDTPISEQIASLRLTMKQLSQLPERFRRAAENWRQGNPEGVLNSLGFSRYFTDFPGIAAGMFANRHLLWLPRAEFYIQKAAELGHRLLIIVGCSHLAGPQTFLADLEERCGYKFRQTS